MCRRGRFIYEFLIRELTALSIDAVHLYVCQNAYTKTRFSQKLSYERMSYGLC